MTDLTNENSAADRDSGTHGHIAAISLLFVLTLFRLWYGAHLGLAEDEAYYWQWSRHLALSYYDQGPGIAYVIRGSTALLGSQPLGLRFLNILMGAGTGWLLFLTMLRWTEDARIALWALVLLNVCPLIAAGSVLATYDGPQVFFWMASLFALTWTLQNDKRGGWYLVGLLGGLGLLCKLTMLLFAPGVLILLLWTPAWRKHLATPHPYLAFGIMLILFSPVFAWNATHGWMGFLHAVSLGSRRRGAAPFRWFGDFLGGQAIALGPFLFLAELYALTRLALKPVGQRVSEEAVKFIVAFGAPTLALCLVVSLKSKLEINWPAPTHLMGLGAVAIVFAGVWSHGSLSKRVAVALATTVSLLLTVGAFFPVLLTRFGKPVSAEKAQKLNETYGWDDIASSVEAARVDLEKSDPKPVFIAGINYRVNSVMAYYLPGQPETQSLYLNSRRDEYVVWTDPKKLVGQNAILCLDDRNEDAVALAHTMFKSITELPKVSVSRPGFEGNVKHWFLYQCRDFKGYDPNRYLVGY